MAVSQGNCFICGKTVSKNAVKNHIMKEHNTGSEECYLIKAEGAHNKDYWLYFSAALDSSLLEVDEFFRDIWCECCGHMSAFRRGYEEIGETRTIASLFPGEIFTYEYDFGTTTEIVIKVIDRITRQKQKEDVQLLARNVPPDMVCEKCGAPAGVINAWEYEALCDECAKNAEEEEALLPITNSPRCGECGYVGERDKWTFNPKGVLI